MSKSARRGLTRCRSAKSRRRPSSVCPIRPDCSRPRRAPARAGRGATSSRPICASSPVSPSSSTASRTTCPSPICPTAEAIGARAQFAMPPLDRGRFIADAAARGDARPAVRRCRRDRHAATAARGAGSRRDAAAEPDATRWLRAVLADAIPVEALAEHVYVAAALQVHFARWRRGSTPTRWCRSATAPARPAAARRSPRMVVGWPARTARASAPARCAARCGTTCASNACSAARPRASPTRRSRAAGHGQGRDLRQLPRLREDPLPAEGSGRSIRSPTTSRASASTCWCARTAYRRGGVNPFLLGY